MKSILPGLSTFLLFVSAFASSSLAAGTAGRTFVSGKGLDTNPCTLASPCRTFAESIAQTGAGGEVVVLDSAGYGPFTVTQAVTITAPKGIYAGITVGTDPGDGIDVSAGSSDVVTLKGLTLIGPGLTAGGFSRLTPQIATPQTFGIRFNSGAALHVEGCEVRGFGFGIAANAPGQVFIKDTVVKDSANGIDIDLGVAGSAFAAVDNVSANNNGAGIIVEADVAGAIVNAEIRDSTISGNTVFGVLVSSTNGQAIIDITGSIITNGGGTGLQATSGGSVAAMSISSCLISHNASAFSIAGGNITSLGNNTIIGNGASFGSLTPFALQ